MVDKIEKFRKSDIFQELSHRANENIDKSEEEYEKVVLDP